MRGRNRYVLSFDVGENMCVYLLFLSLMLKHPCHNLCSLACCYQQPYPFTKRGPIFKSLNLATCVM